MHILRIVLLVCNLMLLLLTMMAYIAPLVSPRQVWFLQFAGMAYPFLLLFNLLFVVIWLLLKTRYLLFSLFLIIVGWSHVLNFVGFSLSNEKSSPGSIKLLTYNVDNFSNLLTSVQRQRTRIAFEKFIKAENPDIICLQESFVSTAEYNNKIKQFAALAAYPWVFHPAEKGIVIFSKFPAAKSAKIDLAGDKINSANGAIYADLLIKGKTVRCIVTHLQSNSVRERADDVIEDKFRSNQTRRTALGVIRKIRNVSYLRAEQSETLRKFIESSPYPVVVAGDFNDTPLSYTYRQISKGLVDTFRDKGQGLGVTYAGSIPGLRIDYILVDPNFEVHSSKIHDVPFSDHLPVSAEISIQ